MPGNDCSTQKGVEVATSHGWTEWFTDDYGGHVDIHHAPNNGSSVKITVTPPTKCGWTCGTWKVLERTSDLKTFKVVKTGSGCVVDLVPNKGFWRTGIDMMLVKQSSASPTPTPKCQIGGSWTQGTGTTGIMNWLDLGTSGTTNGYVNGPEVKVVCPSGQVFTNNGTYCTRWDGKKYFDGKTSVCGEPGSEPVYPDRRQSPTPTPKCTPGQWTQGTGTTGVMNWLGLGSSGDTGYIDRPEVLVSCQSDQTFTNGGTYCTSWDGKKRFNGGTSLCMGKNPQATLIPTKGVDAGVTTPVGGQADLACSMKVTSGTGEVLAGSELRTNTGSSITISNTGTRTVGEVYVVRCNEDPNGNCNSIAVEWQAKTGNREKFGLSDRAYTFNTPGVYLVAANAYDGPDGQCNWLCSGEGTLRQRSSQTPSECVGTGQWTAYRVNGCTSNCGERKIRVFAGSTNCKQCPAEFSCYKKGSGSSEEYKWFTQGYAMAGFSRIDNSQCTSRNVTKPTFKGKTFGDANCDGYVNAYDYSIWRKEFIDMSEGADRNSATWEADFGGSNGTCDGIVNGIDYSIFRTKYRELGGNQ
jgi:hypothetical protein